MSGQKKPNRRGWSKVHIQHELHDLLRLVARKEGYDPDQLHVFILDLVRRQYPATVEAALDWLGRDWLDEDETKGGDG